MSPQRALLSLNAYAKLNLRLHIDGRSGGPLHTIVSAIAQLALCDELTFAPSEGGFAVSCDDPAIADRDNLALRAARSLGVPLPPLIISIRKHIPTRAGLGGGSADAAAALKGLARLLPAREGQLQVDRLQDAARQTGSDVPACLVPGLKIVTGHGEVVRPQTGRLPAWGILLLKPSRGIATADAYALLDTARASAPDSSARALYDQQSQNVEEMCSAVFAADFPRFCRLLHNDFQDIVENAWPDIRDVRHTLVDAGAQATLLCGSGSCVAGFFESEATARTAQAALSLKAARWSAVTVLSADA